MLEFFLRRPIFASVCSAVILLAGLISIPMLPIAQYPNVSPPTVTVTANYTGASAEAVEYSVVTPLEQAINGVQGMRYMSSTMDNTGTATITCTFNLGTDLNVAQNDVQNQVNTVLGRLPQAVTQTGVTVAKQSSSFTLVVSMISDDPNFDEIALSNYIAINIENRLKRVQGVGNVQIFGDRTYAMRLWLDPKKLADYGLAATDVITALQDQNVQVAAGAIGEPPTNGNQPYQYTVQARGRLSTVEEFGNVIIKSNSTGYYLRVKDVGRVSLGAENYLTRSWDNGQTAIGIGIFQLPTANALTVAHGVRSAMADLAQSFPAGVHYDVPYDTTTFVQESIKEVVETLLIAIVLVVGVIYLFLQDWRVTLIPSVTIPISLIGTFALMNLLGFSINTLTLFGLTLATGLVVDDAIVIIENISRYIDEHKMSPFDGALHATREIAGAVFATSLVLLAVFIPAGFLPGTTGRALPAVRAHDRLLDHDLALQRLDPDRRPFRRLLARPVQRKKPLQQVFHGDKPRHRCDPQRNYGRASSQGAAMALRRRRDFRRGPLRDVLALRARSDDVRCPRKIRAISIALAQLPEGLVARPDDQVSRQNQVVEIVREPQSEIVERVFTVAGFSFIGIAPNRGLAFGLLRPVGRTGTDSSTR